MAGWTRYYFKANGDDSRPVIFPPPGPWWETGFAMDESFATVIAYLPGPENIPELKKYWPEAWDIESRPETVVIFTSRFKKPTWWNEQTPNRPQVRMSGGVKVFVETGDEVVTAYDSDNDLF